MKLIEKYNSPTPKKWVKVGRAINALGAALQLAVGGYVAGGGSVDHYFKWVIGITLVTWLGATVTDFASDKQIENEFNDQNNESEPTP